MIKGIDLSHHQPHVNWSGLEPQPAFCFIKASEGCLYEDPLFKDHWAKARAFGVKRGAYHYFHPAKDPIEQAHLFAETIGVLADDDLPCVMDWETTDGVPSTKDVRAALAFLEAVADRTLKKPIIYTGPYFMKVMDPPPVFSRYPLWLANYASQPRVPQPWDNWTFWQYSENERVEGVGTCDVNYFNGTSDELTAFIEASKIVVV